MNISFYTAASAMVAQQTGLDVYSNNIANINTVGYKALRPSFADCLYVQYRETEPEWQTGHGQRVMKTDLMWEQGGFTFSENDLDFALPNDGFFMVEDKNNVNFLTRDGSFNMSNNGETWELVNGSGDYVLDYEGNRIEIPFVTEENAEGEVITTNLIDYDALQATIGVFSVANIYGLDQSDTNHFAATDRSGEPTPEPDFDKLRTALEMSTTDLAGDMVRIIQTQRSYQLAAKLVQTSDELISIANNLRS